MIYDNTVFIRGQKKGSDQKLFYGWVITGAVFFNLAMSYGAQYSFGILFPSLIEEFKWNRQTLSGVFSFYNVMYCALAAILGRAADRFGPKIVLIFGSICLGSGIGLISQVNAPWHLYVVYGLLASLGMSATYITASPTVVKWFIQKRGLALGLCQSGLGVGVIAIPPVSGFLITAFGWRQACIILGSSVFLVLFAMAFLLIGYPERIGLKPDGLTGNSSVKSGKVVQETILNEVTWSVKDAIRTKSFWLVTAMFFCTWLFIFLPLVHLMMFALDIGLSKRLAFMGLSILGAGLTFGRLFTGALSDRIGRKQALVASFALQVFAWLLITRTSSSWTFLLSAATLGLSQGGNAALFPAITGDYFGRGRAGSIIGIIFSIAGPASAIGPFVAGYLHDVTHHYQWAFVLAALANLIALIIALISKPPRQKSQVS